MNKFILEDQIVFQYMNLIYMVIKHNYMVFRHCYISLNRSTWFVHSSNPMLQYALYTFFVENETLGLKKVQHRVLWCKLTLLGSACFHCAKSKKQHRLASPARSKLWPSLVPRPYKIGPGTHCLRMRWINKKLRGHFTEACTVWR